MIRSMRLTHTPHAGPGGTTRERDAASAETRLPAARGTGLSRLTCDEMYFAELKYFTIGQRHYLLGHPSEEPRWLAKVGAIQRCIM